MKKITSILFIAMLMLGSSLYAQQDRTLYDFKVKDINGQVYDFENLKGKKVLIVNVASKCGLTPQYEELEKLQEKYGDSDFTIIGFPSNDFNGQEPGTNEEIQEFCSATYGVTFPLMDKTTVIGENKSELYKWLTQKSENGIFDAEVQWNFQKFLIDENGHLLDFVAPRVSPMTDKILNWLDGK